MNSKTTLDNRIELLEKNIETLNEELKNLKLQQGAEKTKVENQRRQERLDEIARNQQAKRVYAFETEDDIIAEVGDRIIILFNHKGKYRGRTGHIHRTTSCFVNIKLEGCGTRVTKHRDSIAIIDCYGQRVSAGKVTAQRLPRSYRQDEHH